jgi:mycothiol system anti-sigma-R factor
MECTDCIEAAARLHLYIDRELSVEEVAIVQQHLANCPGCKCRFHVDMSIKRLIHERCTIQRAPERLREAVLRLARMPRGVLVALDPELEMEIRADLEERDERLDAEYTQ